MNILTLEAEERARLSRNVGVYFIIKKDKEILLSELITPDNGNPTRFGFPLEILHGGLSELYTKSLGSICEELTGIAMKPESIKVHARTDSEVYSIDVFVSGEFDHFVSGKTDMKFYPIESEEFSSIREVRHGNKEVGYVLSELFSEIYEANIIVHKLELMRRNNTQGSTTDISNDLVL